MNRAYQTKDDSGFHSERNKSPPRPMERIPEQDETTRITPAEVSQQKPRYSYDSADPYEEKMFEFDSPIIPRFYRTNRADHGEGIEQSDKREEPPRPGMDTLNAEYLYYTTLLKDIIPLMSRRADQKKVTKWVEKLAFPAYQTARLREKRNKYMLKLCLNAMNDEVLGIFAKSPPNGVLPLIDDQAAALPPARWEMDNYWSEQLKDLPTEKSQMGCSAHAKCGENRDEKGSQPNAGALLDQEFQLFLYMARPYTFLLERPVEKSRLAVWLQTLAKIRSCSCLAMKGIRNDYIQALLGYLQELRLAGPFQEFPPLTRPLPPLAELAKNEGHGTTFQPFTDPSHPLAEDFINTQPRPENGAFCYIAVTGDARMGTSMDPLQEPEI